MIKLITFLFDTGNKLRTVALNNTAKAQGRNDQFLADAKSSHAKTDKALTDRSVALVSLGS